MNNKYFFIFFLFTFILGAILIMSNINLISSQTIYRDTSLDSMIYKIPRITNQTDFNILETNKTPEKRAISVVDNKTHFVAGNDKVIIQSSKDNYIEFENGIFQERYLSIKESNIKEPVLVTMFVGTHDVLYGIKTHENASYSYSEVAKEGESLGNVKSFNGYITFEVNHFSAVIAGLPDVTIAIPSNQRQYYLPINDYCTNCNHLSTYVQFIDPDTSNLIYVFDDEDYSNDYFWVDNQANYDGIIYFDGYQTLNNIIFTVGVCENAFCSQDTDSFNFRIASTIPEQIASISDPINLGEDEYYYKFMNDVFYYSSYDAVTIQWYDDDLQSTRSISKTKTEISPSCEYGEMIICLRGGGTDLLIEVTSLNKDRVVDLQVEAKIQNPGSSLHYKTLSQGSVRFITSTSEEPPQQNNTIPVQVASIQGINLTGIDASARTLSNYYVNFTANLTHLVLLNDSGVNVTLTAGETLNTQELGVTLSETGNQISVLSKNQNLNNYLIYINPCNSQGCIYNDTLSRLRVDTYTAGFSQQVTISDIELNYLQSAERFIPSYFSGYNNLSVFYPNPNNISEIFQINKGQKNTYNSYFDIELTNSENLIITSYSRNMDFNIIVNVTDGVSYLTDEVNVLISEQTTPTTPSSGTNFFTSIVNFILNFFPEADDLSLSQRIAYFVISCFITTAILLLIAHSQTGGVPQTMLYIIMTLNIGLFFLFVAMGYIPLIVPLTIILVIGLIVFLKLKGGGSSD